MPELPEVETVRVTLKNMIIGKTIRDIDVFYDGIIKEVSVNEFKNQLINQTLIDIDRYGKYLIFMFDDIALISHLRMEGKYFIKKLDENRTKHEHIIFYFTDGTTLRYHDTRKFGTMNLRTHSNVYKTDPIKKLGYEPFNKLLTVSYLEQKLAKKTIAIKTSLLDQTIITGLGNIYVDEVLFLSKIDPLRHSNSLSKTDLKRVIDSSIKVLEKAINLGGTTIRSYTSSLGVTGRFQNELHVHTKEGKRCDICHSTILKIRVNGRGTYYCPKCQK